MYEIIKEGSAKSYVPKEKKISKKLPVFYNPVMKFNRDITILLLQQFPNLRICDPLAATGIRSIRFAKEIDYTSITANDYDKDSIKLIKKNMKINKVKFEVCNEDANLFLLGSGGFDFIDIDPFGTPNPFLDSAVKRLSRDGILAVTATDLAALCGTVPKACIRKYWAKPKHDWNMHETGLRILIRKIQLIGAQFDKALTPLLCYYKDHYFRIFLKCEKGKQKVDDLLKCHGMFGEAGPLYLGSLFDRDIVDGMLNLLSIKGSMDNNISQLSTASKNGSTKAANKKNSLGNKNLRYNLQAQDKLKKVWLDGNNSKNYYFNDEQEISGLNNSSNNNKNNPLKLLKNNKEMFHDRGLLNFLKIINDESKQDIIGFYDIHEIIKRNKLKIMPKKTALMTRLHEKGYSASQTHISGHGIKSNITEKGLVKIIKNDF